jgi:putative endonuclease
MRELGNRAEDRAALYLKNLGYRVVERNYRSKRAEIDIIAEDGQTVVFVEVKSRKSAEYGSPAEAVNFRKRAKIKEAALHYLAGKKKDPPARFDVISILPGGIEHIKDAFEVD